MRASTRTAKRDTTYHLRPSSTSLGLISACLVLLGVSATGCGSSSRAHVAPTPTATLYPTATPFATATAFATATPSPTAAPFATATPTASPTPNPVLPFVVVGEPEVANGIVYVTRNNDYLYALDASDGRQLWRFHGDDASAGGPPTVANGVVYFGAQNTCNSYSPSPPYLYAVNAATGALIWRAVGTAFPRKLLVANGAIYSGSCEGRIAAYRATGGGQLWSLGLGGGCSTDALAVDATYLYVNEFACYGVVTLRVGDGSGVWQHPFGGGGAPTLVNGVLYVGPQALRASDGSILRTFQASGGSNATDAVANGVVYIPNSPYLSAWNTSTGAQIWQIVPQGGAYIFGVGNGAIYAGNRSNLYAYQAGNGTQLWSVAVSPVVPEFDPLPTSLGSTLYVGTLTGEIVALRASDGAIMWTTMLQ